MKRTAVFLWCFCFFSTVLFADSHFQRLAESFLNAKLPTRTQLSGYWAGRCADAEGRDALSPAIFLFKEHASGETTEHTLTYFRDLMKAPNTFDEMTPSEVEAYPDIKAWFAREQWNKVRVLSGSLLNLFYLSGGTVVERAVRIEEDEFNRRIYLRATQKDGTLSTVQRYCYFDKWLGAAPTPGEPSEKVSLAKYGVLSNVQVSIPNRYSEFLFYNLEVTNKGSYPVTLQDFRVTLYDGRTALAPDREIQPGQTLVYRLTRDPSFYFTQLEFYVNGWTEGLEVRGTVKMTR